MKELGEEDLTVSLNDISSDSFDNDSNHHQFNQNYSKIESQIRSSVQHQRMIPMISNSNKNKK